MGWGEAHLAPAGTTGQIEDAHRALTEIGIHPGPLAIRALEAVGMIVRLREQPSPLMSPEEDLDLLREELDAAHKLILELRRALRDQEQSQ